MCLRVAYCPKKPKRSKNMEKKEVKLTKHGNYLYGVLDGVDFVSAGVLENGTKYGASAKLKFITKATAIKTVDGVEIATQKAITQTIKVPCANSELSMLVKQYNDLIGKELLINYNAPDNNIFLASGAVGVDVVK